MPDLAFNDKCDYPAWGLTNCNGHGKCIDSKCVCDSGWTGASDWNDMEGYGCQTNTIAIRVLWAIPTLIALVNLSWHIPLVAHMLKDLKWNLKALLEKPAGRFNSLLIFWSTGIIIVGCCKMADPIARQIGPNDPVPFNIFCLGSCLFYWGVTIFNKMQIKLALKGMGSKGDDRMKKMDMLVGMLNPKAALDSAVLIAAVIVGNVGWSQKKPDLVTISYLIFNGWRFFTMLLTMVQVLSMKFAVFKAFEGIGDNIKPGDVVDEQTQKIVKLKKTMTDFVKDAIKAVVLNGSSTLLFVCYQGVWSSWGYFTPIQMTLGTVVILGAKAIFVKEVKKKAKGNKVGATATTQALGNSSALQSTQVSTSSLNEST